MTSTRDRITQATNELFRRQGYNGTSLKDITAASGATTGSLYHFFPDGKVALGAAVIVESGAAYQQLFEVMADEAATPAMAVSAFFDGAADVLEQTDFIDICPIGTVAREVASTNEILRQATEQVFASWIEAAAARFRLAGLASDLADELAVTVVSTLEGAFVLARASRRGEPVRAAGRQMAVLVDLRVRASASFASRAD